MAEQIRDFMEMDLPTLEAYIASRVREAEGDHPYLGQDGTSGDNDKGLVRRLVDAVMNQINASPAKFRQVICVDYSYCQKRQGDEVTLVAGIADALTSFCTGIPIPTVSVAAYFVRKRLLDPFCNCES